MNTKADALSPEQKADALKLATVLRNVPMNEKLICSLTVSAYIDGVKAGRVIEQSVAAIRGA